MSPKEKAIHLDLQGAWTEAVEAYELCLANCCDEECSINLACLYWQFCDFGMSSSLTLTKDFIDFSYRRYGEIITEAQNYFPTNGEISFWKCYFDFISNGKPFSSSDCLAILSAYSPNSFVPYFFLYGDKNGSIYSQQVTLLQEECRLHPTAKNRYILSHIESVSERRK